MNREDIIRMAREADFAEGLSDTLRGVALVWDAETKHLERFAALLREKMVSDGWRQCAEGQRTTQHCAVAEQARQQRESINGPIVQSSGEQLARSKT